MMWACGRTGAGSVHHRAGLDVEVGRSGVVAAGEVLHPAVQQHIVLQW